MAAAGLTVRALELGTPEPASDAPGGDAPAAPTPLTAAALEPGVDPRPPADNQRWTVDLSTRLEIDDDTGEPAATQAVGLDLHRVVTDAGGDRATIVLQAYLIRLDNQPRRAAFFEGDDDWELNWRIFNVNLHLAPRGALSLRVGHLELPFGLEWPVNTNGTLRNFANGANTGLKADWGASLNGMADDLDYEVALTRGSGNGWHDTGDPWLASGRLGWRVDPDLRLGVSGLVGRPNPAAADDPARWARAGVDVTRDLGPLTLRAEASGGETAGAAAFHGLGEVGWRDRSERWFVYGQIRHFDRAPRPTTAALGLRYTPDRHWALSAEVLKPVRGGGGNAGAEAALFRTQLRYRF